jgi:hypothetical protein
LLIFSKIVIHCRLDYDQVSEGISQRAENKQAH